MAEKIQVVVDFEGDFQKEFTKASRTVSTQSKKMQKNIGGATSAVKQLSGAIATFAAARTAINFLTKSAQLADKQAKAVNALTVAYGKNTKALEEQAAALQKVTLFGDEETIAAQARLAQFTKEEQQIRRLIPLIQDFATAKGMDLSASAELVGKTFASSTNALTRYGIEVQGAAGSSERFAAIVAGLEKQVKGASEAAAQSGLGPWQQLVSRWGDAQEILGAELIPAVNRLAENMEGIDAAARMVGGSVRFVFKSVEGSLQVAFGAGQKLGGALRNTVLNVLTILDKIPSFLLPDAVEGKIQASIENLEALKMAYAGVGDKTIQDGLSNVRAGMAALTGETAGDGTTTPATTPTSPQNQIGAVRTQSEELNAVIFSAQDKRVERALTATEIIKQAEKEAMEEYEKDVKKKAEIQENTLRATLSASSQFFGGISRLAFSAAQENKKHAGLYKTIATTQATIDTFASANAAYKAMAGIPYVGPALGVVAAAGAIAAGLANVAQIQSQKFTQGGIVGGNSSTGDRINAGLNSGEMILNNAQQRNLFNAIDGGSIGTSGITVSDTIIIQGNADEAAMTKYAETKEAQIEKMRELLIEMRSIGQLPAMS